MKEELSKERDELQVEAVGLREQLTASSTSQLKAEADLEQADAKITEVSIFAFWWKLHPFLKRVYGVRHLKK